jgi:hypothetical protein
MRSQGQGMCRFALVPGEDGVRRAHPIVRRQSCGCLAELV